MKSIIEQLPHDKVKINWNKKPIPMNTFLSFLDVEVVRTPNCMGSDNGWTEFANKDLKLLIGGGIFGGVNYLNSIQFGDKLQNKYNNYCNPFYLFGIMKGEGKMFFLDYYKKEIEDILSNQSGLIESLNNRIESEKEHQSVLIKEYESYTA